MAACGLVKLKKLRFSLEALAKKLGRCEDCLERLRPDYRCDVSQKCSDCCSCKSY